MAKRFISFEGIDGSGKSTQLALLAEHLSGEVVQTREPYGQEIRRLLHDSGGDYAPLSQLFLFAAARHQHVDGVIRPALARGAYVLCDRYSDSTLAYQGYGFGLELEMIAHINALSTGGLLTDASFIMDIDVDKMFGRLKERGSDMSSYERLPREFYEKVRAGYQAIARAASARCHLIAADRPKEEIAEEIRAILGV